MKNKNVSVACCIPIGALDRYGYQYIWKEALANHSQAFDKVYLYTTTRANVDLNIEFDNVEFIIDDEVLLDIDENELETFSIYKIYNAYNLSVERAKNDGIDFVVCSAINSYLDDDNSLNMRIYLNKLKANNQPFGYFAKAFQLYDKICYPNSLLPFIINVDFINDITLDVDVLEYNGTRYGWKGGFHDKFPFYFTDVFGIETLADFECKFEWYIKSYMKEWQGENVSFNADNEIKKFQTKVGKLAINHEYKHSEIIEKFSKKIVPEALVRTIPFNVQSKYLLIAKSYALNVLEYTGLIRFIGNK
ncbi:MAG: hypothetical protein QMC62_01525 [Alteromonadaceae bacterium]